MYLDSPGEQCSPRAGAEVQPDMLQRPTGDLGHDHLLLPGHAGLGRRGGGHQHRLGHTRPRVRLHHALRRHTPRHTGSL